MRQVSGVVDECAEIRETGAAQPALIVFGYAPTQLRSSWGIRPQAVLGHSVGECVAACLSGVFTLPGALCLVALYGQLMQAQQTGRRLRVGADRATVLALLLEGVSSAAHNGPRDCASTVFVEVEPGQPATTSGPCCLPGGGWTFVHSLPGPLVPRPAFAADVQRVGEGDHAEPEVVREARRHRMQQRRPFQQQRRAARER